MPFLVGQGFPISKDGPAPLPRVIRFTPTPGLTLAAICESTGGQYAGEPLARKRRIYSNDNWSGEVVLGYGIGTGGDSAMIDTLFVFRGNPVTFEVTSFLALFLELNVPIQSPDVSIIANSSKIMIAHPEPLVEGGPGIRIRSYDLNSDGLFEDIAYQFHDRTNPGVVSLIDTEMTLNRAIPGTRPRLMAFADGTRPYMFYLRERNGVKQVVKYAIPRFREEINFDDGSSFPGDLDPNEFA